MITESIKVSTAIGMSTVILREENRNSYHDSNERVVNTPKSTKAAIFPMRVVPMNQVGLWIKNDIIFAPKFPFFPCSSMCILFAERKATSIPDKNIEKISEPIIAARNALSIVTFFAFLNYKEKRKGEPA